MSGGSHGNNQVALMNGSEDGGERTDASELFDQKLDAKLKATVNEAGRREGRVVKALVLGEQRYPDPTVWGQKSDGRLIDDEGFREGLDLLSRLDRRRERD